MSVAENTSDEFEKVLEEDPGNSVFCDYAEQLRIAGNFPKALDVCLKGLSVNPDFHKGRLALARIFYEQSYLPFAIREVKCLSEALPDNRYLQRLYAQLAPDQVSGGEAAEMASEDSDEAGSGEVESSGDDTVAEVDFDFDELEMIDDED